MCRRAKSCVFLFTLLVAGMSPGYALAQSNENDASVLRQEARELYVKAVERLKAGRFAQARASFLAAWALEQHWSIALGLGECELEMGKHRDAAEHFDYALRKMPPEHESRAQAQDALKQTSMLVAKLEITVDVDGVELFVDGQSVGTSPLKIPVFVEPGDRTIEGRLPNREPSRTTIATRAGGAYPVRFMMAPGIEPGTPPSVEQAPPPKRDAGVAPVDAGPTEEGSNARTIVTWTGAGLTLAAAGIGLVYTLKASSASSDAESLQTRIDTELGSNGCRNSSSPLCTDLRDRFDERDDAATAATTAWIVSGVLLGGTLGAYLLWPEEESGNSGQTSSGTRWTWAPVVLPQGAAVSLQGSLP